MITYKTTVVIFILIIESNKIHYRKEGKYMKKFSDFICKNKNIVLIISFVLLALSFIWHEVNKNKL